LVVVKVTLADGRNQPVLSTATATDPALDEIE
jgi:hypothetical protein